MSKNKICLILVLFVLIAVIASLTSVAYALPYDRYIEADITLSSISVFGENTVAEVSFWESEDNKSWLPSSDFDSSWCDLVYYNADDNSAIGTNPPSAVGSYIVRALVNDKYNQSNYFFKGKKLEKNTVLSSFAYRIVYENLAVVFSPNTNVLFDSGKNYYNDVVKDTKIYYKGTALQKDTDYTISLSIFNGENYIQTEEAINPGNYKITVELNDLYPNANLTENEHKFFESTFEIVNSVANIVTLDSAKKYEGMFQNDSDARLDYYSVKYGGLITSDANLINKYTISYICNNKTLTDVPVEAGNYTVRFTFTENIPLYEISNGDFVDLQYSIYEKPYTVRYEHNATSRDGYNLVYQGQPIIITPVFNESIKINSDVKYFIAQKESESSEKYVYKQLSYGVYPENVGKYKAEFKIDVSNGNIGGSAFFGTANESYVIDENNNTLTFEFQIIPRLTVNFNSDHKTTGTGYSSIVDYSGVQPQIIESIQDSTLADVSRDLYRVEYFDKDWNRTDALRSGEYHGVITFTVPNNGNINEDGQNYWSNGDTIIVDGTKYYFDFLIQKSKSSITAVKVNNGIVLNFGAGEIDAYSYDVQYFKFENLINYKTVNSELVNQVGVYHILVSFNADNLDLGFEKGETYVIEYVNSSEGSLENVKLFLDNVTESGSGYSIKYDGNVKPVNVRFENSENIGDNQLNYSLYYQKLARNTLENEQIWSICDYPVLPGNYRAVLVVNEPNIFFNAKTGDTLIYEYTITALELVPAFEVKVDEYTEDLVFDNNPYGKDFNVSFTVNNRPVHIDSSFYTLRYAYNENGVYSTFKAENPVNAGDYRIAVYFNYNENGLFDKYGIYCGDETISSPEDFTVEKMASRSVFSKTITVEKLSLTLVSKIPVEEMAMYDLNGGEVKPTYSFYKTNGYVDFSNYEEFLNILKEKGDAELSYVGIDDFESELLTGNINSISCDKKVDKSVSTGRYINNLSLDENSRKNIVIDKVLYTYEGAKPHVEYNQDFYYANRKSDLSFTVEYRVSPLPLIINSTALETIAENLFEEHYFGNTKPVTTDKLLFSTLSRTGEKYNLKDDYSGIVDNLISYIDLRYYKRLSGESITENKPILAENSFGELTSDLGTVAGFIFDSGDYTLRIRFNGALKEEYSYFTLYNGYNSQGALLNGNEMEENSYADIQFRVLNANPLRVVFDRSGFDSFVADGNEKAFNIKFMCGNVEVTGLNYSILKFRCTGDVEEQITGSEYPKLAGKYAIQVSFDTDNFKYKIEQNENSGECSSDAPYIVNQAYVKFYYTITNPVYLSWDFYLDGEKLNSYSGLKYSFSGLSRNLDVIFFDTNNPSNQVNLIENIDYAIWYYKTSSKGYKTYEKLLEPGSEPDSYVAELVFLRTLHDYKINDDSGIPYSYQEAELVDGRFGRSLVYSSNNNLYLTMFNEKRYVEYDIVQQNLVVGNLRAENKVFDNSDCAELIGKYKIVSINNSDIVPEYLNIIEKLLSKGLKATFENVSVGVNSLNLYLTVYSDGENEILLPLPQEKDISSLTAHEFLINGLNELKNSSDYGVSEVKTAIDDIETQVNKLFSHYDLCFKDISGVIEKSKIIVTPLPFTRDYDPFYRDNDRLQFTYENDLVSSFALDIIFRGSLTREGRDTESKVGNYKIILGDLSVVDSLVTLSDGQNVALNQCFDVKLANSSVYYTITKKAITVAITNGLSKLYDEDDPQFVCEVTSGQLISGDSLIYTGKNSPIRKSNKARDDVGEYEIDMSPIAIVDSQGSDMSSNYRISYVKAVFTIMPKEIVIVPFETANAKYTDNFYELYDLNSDLKRYTIKYNLNGILKDYVLSDGYSLSGSFGLEEVANTDKQISAKYKITLGSIGVKDGEGKNVSKNYLITTRGTYYYTVKKIPVYLDLLPQVVTKTYSSPDPAIPFKELSSNALPEGYSLRADSSATRKAGEEVGEYEILLNNSDNIYIIEDATKNVVTEYFYIIIRNSVSDANPKGVVFKIEPFELHVSVKEETFIKGYSTIIAEMIFKDKDGKNVPKSILEKMTVSFKPLIIENPVEGINQVDIAFSSNENDPNFRVITESGFVTVVFPENNVSVKVIDDNEEIVHKNAYIFTNGMLLETKQMYLASTDNGKNPTKYISIDLPVKNEFTNKELYVVAVRGDGSYEILDADVKDGIITISDDEFNYILLCSLKVWPFYLLGAIAILVIIGILAFVVAKLVRRKRRNGEKAVNFRKLKKEIRKEHSYSNSSGYKPTENEGNTHSFDDIIGSTSNIGSASANNVINTETKIGKNKPSKNNKEEVVSENNNKVDLKESKNKPTKNESIRPTSSSIQTTPIVPSTKANRTDDELIIPTVTSENDDLVISTQNKIESDGSVNTSDYSNDDEIIISKSKKIGIDSDL